MVSGIFLEIGSSFGIQSHHGDSLGDLPIREFLFIDPMVGYNPGAISRYYNEPTLQFMTPQMLHNFYNRFDSPQNEEDIEVVSN